MNKQTKRRLLVIGATGKVGREVVLNLVKDPSVQTVAAIRRDDQSQSMLDIGAEPVWLDLDNVSSVEKSVNGIDGILLMTGYTVDMMKHSKRVIDAAKRANVSHIVHIGASGADTAEVSHWGWHQMIEAYIEKQGFRFTHLRPEGFMQNLLSFGWLQPGALTNLIGNARWSWVDARDVAAIASEALKHPDKFSGQTWRLGYDAATMIEVAEMISELVEQPVKLEQLDPQIFFERAVAAGADPAYMACIRDQFRLNAAGAIPNADETFDKTTFEAAVGRLPSTWKEFIQRNSDDLKSAASS
ncbi:NAD(P)-dependent oxidoreductase [Microbulbifer sp. A4B17]|uniref:NmrA family NAD(P)-binding protein n=1 Tax=Microbulbifer sp. A4B17 TaxID=359370 RepID=UPI000D52D844|nr:NmrA family NAD(P)-binding protein [Microbulbifer sp. A4B17]AWF81357.1 NAD(P)-dependent oxidoreductase [Microbulbifer sp. A4B17]